MALFVYKTYQELSKDELYHILKIRASVFIVEQNCVYQDIDDMDQDALHLWMIEEGKIVSYARVLKANTYLDEVAIGRVISLERNKGYGKAIFAQALDIAQNKFQAEIVKIRAQQQVEHFYNQFNFQRCRQPLCYAGLLHVDMIWKKQ